MTVVPPLLSRAVMRIGCAPLVKRLQCSTPNARRLLLRKYSRSASRVESTAPQKARSGCQWSASQRSNALQDLLGSAVRVPPVAALEFLTAAATAERVPALARRDERDPCHRRLPLRLGFLKHL